MDRGSPDDLSNAADEASDKLTALIKEVDGDVVKLTGLAMAMAAASGVLTASVTMGVEDARVRMTDELVGIMQKASLAGGAEATSQGLRN